MIKGILFDLDETLLDRKQSLISFLQSQYDRYPVLQAIERELFLQRFIQLDRRGQVWKDIVYRQLVREFELNLSWEELLEDYIESFQHHCIGFAGMIEILEDLKSSGIRLGVISNGRGHFQRNSIKGLKIEPYLDAVLISEIEGVRKPDVEIFRRGLERLGLESKETFFIGDHPLHDVEASMQAGMIGVWKENEFFEKPKKYDHTIENLEEIKRLLIHYSQ